MISQRAIDAIEYSDTDELIRVIDGICESGDWDRLIELRERCREAVTRGKQVWGVEELIRYRVALEAPPEHAGPAVSEGVARFALGPLGEVAASTKTWAEMAPFLEEGPEKATFAAERVLRGDTGTDRPVDLPGSLMDWEPHYLLATYKADKVEAPSPPIPETQPIDLPAHVERIDDPESEGALADLVAPWSEQSNGQCETATVHGSAPDAVRALGLTRARIGEIQRDDALRWMSWAAASGGAHGRRRGGAAGRYGTWWVLASLADLEWPVNPDELAEIIDGFRWFWFDDGAPGTGWQLKLVVEDPKENLAWAISAVDSAD